MNDFLLIFRNDTSAANGQQSPEQMAERMKQWQAWLGGIAAQNKLISAGNKLFEQGNVVRQGGQVTDGPYVEIKESIGGYSMIKAADLAEATELSKGCPIFNMGGNVEVRQIVPMNM
ncbi:MAG: YciI family protein [Bacteroidota bacterium]